MSKPTAVKVFGIINIIFGAIGIVTSPLNFINLNRTIEMFNAEGFYRTWFYFTIWVAPISSLILLILGIGLLRYQEWGRRGTVLYSWFVIVLGILSSIITLSSVARQLGSADPAIIGLVIGGFIGTAIGLIYPIISLIFLTKPSAREACR